jgi:anti-sigma regulatory factor (Ser/Thr protein kinase)
LYTDHKKLSQILRNFISNALKFTPNGSVRVSAVYDSDETVTFSVIDTGIGIEPEHLPTLFNDFVQLDSSLQKRLRGTGLGLSLSKRLAELLGGSVGVESELGVGSTFFVTIPIRLTGHEADLFVTHSPSPARLRPCQLARSPSFSSSTTTARPGIRPGGSCAPPGFEVKEAATGTDALELAKDDVDAIVLDVNLPDVDGFEVCRRLRARPESAADADHSSVGDVRRRRRPGAWPRRRRRWLSHASGRAPGARGDRQCLPAGAARPKTRCGAAKRSSARYSITRRTASR